MGSRLGDRDKRHDRYYQKARQERFAARAVYKLEEIDVKVGLFKPGARVLDLGCRPGSWLQYAAGKVGDRGVLVGVDREPLAITVPRARILVGDVYKLTMAELLGDVAGFDVVLSDMAPDTTGVRQMDQARSEGLFEKALEIAEATLAPGGSFVGKLFQGPDFQRLLTRVRTRFATAKSVKPDSSRKESIEQYIVGVGYRPSSST